MPRLDSVFVLSNGSVKVLDDEGHLLQAFCGTWADKAALIYSQCDEHTRFYQSHVLREMTNLSDAILYQFGYHKQHGGLISRIGASLRDWLVRYIAV